MGELRYGARGAEVLDLQNRLVSLGLMTQAQVATGPGIFGRKTEAAVVAFQLKNNLVDGMEPGVVNTATRLALFGNSTPNTPQTALKAPMPRRSMRQVARTPVRFTTQMAIDADGAPNVSRKKTPGKIWDPDYQPTTALTNPDGTAINADAIPYIVLPQPLMRARGIQLGDLARVTYNGNTVYAIVADVGPDAKLGEGSMALARRLGIPSDPHSGGVSGGVEYSVVPRSGSRRAWTADEIQQRGAEVFTNA